MNISVRLLSDAKPTIWTPRSHDLGGIWILSQQTVYDKAVCENVERLLRHCADRRLDMDSSLMRALAPHSIETPQADASAIIAALYSCSDPSSVFKSDIPASYNADR